MAIELKGRARHRDESPFQGIGNDVEQGGFNQEDSEQEDSETERLRGNRSPERTAVSPSAWHVRWKNRARSLIVTTIGLMKIEFRGLSLLVSR